ncbi:serine protease 27-like [Hippocampus zosterae]|uniref:serine protease 27-like n=1 Tax=Hippocampus zosterae TaxID=109293 RepID=UPI00223CCA05|nr:serine protease 27-like [Hippocampus zosterae]
MPFLHLEVMDELMLTNAMLLLLLVTECAAQPDVCGRAVLNNRIVGGQETSQGDWPWQASLQFDTGKYFCGASLINSEWLLSAAHCFIRNIPMMAVLGLQSLEGPNPNNVSRSIVEVIYHPNYNSISYDNDVALVRLSSPVPFNDFIGPVCLAAKGSTFYSGIESWVTGWGKIGEGVPLPSPKNLMEVKLPVVGNRQCGCDFKSLRKITDNMICAGLREGGKDACQGDSGSPMVTKQDSKWIQSGVVSFGQGCARPKLPGVYARVSQYQDWISNHTGNDNLPGFVTFTSPGTDPDLEVSCDDAMPTTSTGTPISPGMPPPVLCGFAPLNERQSGSGSASVAAGDWPWLARLYWNGTYACSGTLVAQDTVLTSAECIARSSTVSNWTVFLGDSNSSETAVGVIAIRTSARSGPNVAVLQLAYWPELSNFIWPICIDNGQIFTTGFICWAVGWNASQGGGMCTT